MKKLILCLIGSVYGFLPGIAQEVQFTQYFATSVYLNPAFSAIYVDPTVYINYRRPINNGYVYNETNQASLTLPMFKNKLDQLSRGGLGVVTYMNNSGSSGSDVIFKITGALFNYAHNVSVGRLNTEVLALGIQAGFENYRTEGERWGSGYNPYIGYDDQIPTPTTALVGNSTHLILNTGIMYFYNRERNFVLYNYSAFSGFAVTNVNRPNKSLIKDGKSRAPMLYKYHGGIEFKIRKFNILPNIIGQYQSGNYAVNGGLYAWYSIHENAFGTGHNIKLVTGAWYRLRESFNFLIGMNYNSISVKASYDLNSNFLYKDNIDYSRSYSELSIQYTITKENRVRKISNPLF